MSWEPSANLQKLRARATLLYDMRQFFAQRNVLEVQTPLLCSAGVTDPAIEALIVERGESLHSPRFLQTSPEYAMKRLLAAGSGAIYEITRAFRDGEAGDRHNPEFSILEWYRPGFDDGQLMDEVAALVCECLGDQPWQKLSYRQLFLDLLNLDPLTAPQDVLERKARDNLDIGELCGDRDLWLDVLMSHLIEPQLASYGMCFVYDYPASQAALARVEYEDGIPVARRFELYVNGLELANGYYELGDAVELRRRFDADNKLRQLRGQAQRPVDLYLIAALQQGLPDCSGVALGIDRLLMLKTASTSIREVLAFPWDVS